jgi:hypothetical protein
LTVFSKSTTGDQKSAAGLSPNFDEPANPIFKKCYARYLVNQPATIHFRLKFFTGPANFGHPK